MVELQFNAYGEAGHRFLIMEDQSMVDHIITPDVLDEMIRQQRKQLQQLLQLRGERYNPAAELCREVGISKRYLAYGLALQEQGNISVSELSRRLDVSRTTIHRYWPEVGRALKNN